MEEVNNQNRLTWRQRQAQATRALILATAQSLFLEHGYAGTTVEAIAEQAGVAVSTVYAVFGSKLGILRGIREGWHERSHIREVALSDTETTEPAQRLVQLAQATRQQWETGAEVIAVYKGAAAADPQAAAELAAALQGRREAMRAFAHHLAPHLRGDLDVAQAAAIVQALCLSEVYDELVTRAGWSADAYEAWLLKVLKRELLGL
ncbi:MAG: TetR/AcrR family transcriptional regulator [Anaerolineae bacterium]|nr:TetR/AcrR family transcriptional regulator [Anaerolineae bacterium]